VTIDDHQNSWVRALAAISSSRCFFLRKAKSLSDILTLGAGGGVDDEDACGVAPVANVSFTVWLSKAAVEPEAELDAFRSADMLLATN
jgi:hypothetical protein